MENTDPIAGNLREIRTRVASAAQSVDRNPADVTLVAVAKTHPAEAVVAALAAGQTVFGENRVQEAQAKYPDLQRAHPELRLHLIGPLQTNKVKDAVALFDAIQTVDREKLARALAAEIARQNRKLELFVQVNIGEEPQKAGIAPREADAFIALCRNELALPGRRPDVHSAGGPAARAVLRLAARDRPSQRAHRTQHGHERRL